MGSLSAIQRDLYNKRIKICLKCDLYLIDPIVGAICNPNSEKGCGCLLEAVTRIKEAVCPANK
jgi:hypothetical protein